MVKKLIMSTEVLALFDPNKPTMVQKDASSAGLGCVLMQEGRPIAFASRTLSKSEVKYAQIEKELLAITFACDRFNFTVESDHKPLESLMKRDIDDVAMRLQRMMIKLLRYAKMQVVFKPGKEMYIADCLSRAQVDEIEEDTEITTAVHSVIKRACVSEDNLLLYRELLAKDKNLVKICEFVDEKWPGYHQLDKASQQFYRMKGELRHENGILFVGDRLVTPKLLQGKMAKFMHGPHLGIEKTKAACNRLYYWANMHDDLLKIAEECQVCAKFRRNNQKEPLVQEEAPKYPLQRVGIDLFEWGGKDFVSVYDAYSNHLSVRQLQSKSSSCLVETLTGIFDVVGYPSIIRADNNPFNSASFKAFGSKYNIRIKYSSPRYPQSNGLAEKGVAVAKNLLKKALEEGKIEEFQYRILHYNDSPVSALNRSPNELFSQATKDRNAGIGIGSCSVHNKRA